MTELDEAISADDLAKLLGIARNSVYDAATRGEIPHRRVGRRILFFRRAIAAWMAGP